MVKRLSPEKVEPKVEVVVVEEVKKTTPPNMQKEIKDNERKVAVVLPPPPPPPPPPAPTPAPRKEELMTTSPVPSRPTLHIMLDLESLGTNTDALVTEIAAMTFEMDSKENQNYFTKTLLLRPEDNVIANVATLNFWLEDEANTEKLKNLLGPTPLEAERRVSENELWYEFYSWLTAIVEQYPEHDIRIWGNGIGFDIAKLNYNLERRGLKSPISFRNEMDMRTLLYYAGEVSGKSRDSIRGMFTNKNPHSALADVRYQVQVVQYCDRVLRGDTN